jgi:hypothetical protein
MDDQDDDGTDGTGTSPEQDLAPSALVEEILEFGTQLGLILGHILSSLSNARPTTTTAPDRIRTGQKPQKATCGRVESS